jgi:hypothetical protein
LKSDGFVYHISDEKRERKKTGKIMQDNVYEFRKFETSINPAIVAFKHPASELVNMDQTYKQLGPTHRPVHPYAQCLGQPDGIRNPGESGTSHLSTMHRHLVNGIQCNPETQYFDRNLERCVNKKY